MRPEFDHTGKPNELIAVISRKPLTNRALVETALQMVAVRASGELERLQAEEILRESELKHAKMLANIGDVIVIIDAAGINRYKSPNLERLFGWQPEEVVGRDTFENIHPDDEESARKFIGRLLAEPNATGTAQCRYQCKDGSYKWIGFTGVNLQHDPNIQGILGNYHDITERKQTEAMLQEKLAELAVSNAELERFNRAMVGRELRMIELKQEINRLCRRLGEPPLHAVEPSDSSDVSDISAPPTPPPSA